jgi:hypothetical protein
MKTTKNKLMKKWLLYVAMICVGVVTSKAQVITVPNFSFENDVRAEGVFTQATPTGWNSSFGAATELYTVNATDAYFTGSTGGNVPAPGQGLNVFLYNSYGTGASGMILQSASSLATTVANTTYTLTVAVGWGASNPYPGIYKIQLVDFSSPGTVFATTTLDANPAPTFNPSGPSGGFQDMTASFTDLVGGSQLAIRLIGENNAPAIALGQGWMDNVRLVATIPEPSINSLIFSGILILLLAKKRNIKALV